MSFKKEEKASSQKINAVSKNKNQKMALCPYPDDASLPTKKADVVALIGKLNKEKGVNLSDAGTMAMLLGNIRTARDKWEQDAVDAADAKQAAADAIAKGKATTTNEFATAALLLTKASALPSPLELTNPRFLKEIDYYAVFFESLPLAELHLRTSFNTQGELLIAFTAACHEVWSVRGQPPNAWQTAMFEKLRKVFLQLADVFLLIRSSKKTPANYSVMCKTTLEEGRNIIKELDIDYIGKTNGRGTAIAYRKSISLDGKKFAESSSEALTQAKKARTDGGAGGNGNWGQAGQVYHDVDSGQNGVLPAPAEGNSVAAPPVNGRGGFRGRGGFGRGGGRGFRHRRY